MELHDFLISKREEMPKWLKDYKPGDRIDFSSLLDNRTVYYPGSRFDGQPIKTFNKAHFAHVYIYADYHVSKQEAKEEFMHRGFVGYKCLALFEIEKEDLVGRRGWRPHIHLNNDQFKKATESLKEFPPFGLVCILERDSNHGEEHGAERFVVIYLCADGIATYDALFGNEHVRPHTLVLQDHGFGGNYDHFGKDGLMHKIAKTTKKYPEFILCADNTEIWDGYEKTDTLPVQGGEYFFERYLYKLK